MSEIECATTSSSSVLGRSQLLTQWHWLQSQRVSSEDNFVLFSWVTRCRMPASKPARRPCSGIKMTLYAAVTGVASQNTLFDPIGFMCTFFLRSEKDASIFYIYTPTTPPLEKSCYTSEYESQVNLECSCLVTFFLETRKKCPFPKHCWYSSSLDFWFWEALTIMSSFSDAITAPTHHPSPAEPTLTGSISDDIFHLMHDLEDPHLLWHPWDSSV